MADGPITTAPLDWCDRADENPIDPGSWTKTFSGSAGLKLASKAIFPASTSGYATWTESGPFTDFEAWTVVRTFQQGMELHGRAANLNGSSVYNGYAGQFSSATAQAQIVRYDSGNTTVLRRVAPAVTLAIGDKIAFTGYGTILKLWWKPIATGLWLNPVTVQDDTYASGYIGMGFSPTATSMSAAPFGGGPPILGPVTPELIFGRGATW